MVKHFNIIMAAVISGTVALFTSVLGVSGTVIGSVLSTFLYQLLSGYSEEKYEEGALKKPRLANEIVYIFPLVVIGILELIFFLSLIHYRFDMIFDILESAVSNNLFRLMGVGLILLGAYPFFNSNDIDKRNGIVVLVLGVLLLLRGLMDISDLSSKVFYMFFAPFDMVFALLVVIILALVIINILIGSERIFSKSNEVINTYKPTEQHARKIRSSLNENFNLSGNDGEISDLNDDFNQNNDYAADDLPFDEDQDSSNISYQDSNIGHQENPDSLPIYEEEVILVNNPEDPENPIKKRILKRIKPGNDEDNDDYQDMYIIDESE